MGKRSERAATDGTCAERDRLLDRYCALVVAYGDAVWELPGQYGNAYELAWAHAEELRAIAIVARLALEEHQADHQCNSGVPAPELAALK